jgi:hypothetical protein
LEFEKVANRVGLAVMCALGDALIAWFAILVAYGHQLVVIASGHLC